MTQNDDPYAVAHIVARLAGEEDPRHTRQRLAAWVTKHYPDRPELSTVVNRAWGTAHSERAGRVFLFERYAAACKALDGLYAGTGDIPPGGFHAYLADWCYFNSRAPEPDASFRRPARAGAARARPAPAAAVRAEDQPALSAGLGA